MVRSAPGLGPWRTIEGVEFLETLARHTGPRGEVVLRRRTGADGVVEELLVNGAFAMDSRETSTERQLGRFATSDGRRRVLIGGLGLGYTAAQVLAEDAARVDVVEIEECLISWARVGVTSTLAGVAADPRVRLHAGDVGWVLSGLHNGPPGPWDAIILDVDNGPDFLIYPSNAGLYGFDTLQRAHGQLTPGGTLAIWCQQQAPDLLATLRRISPAVTENIFQVTREGRTFGYAIYALTRPGPELSVG